jgi:lipopolysaccharide/colanic/teichoic acid biosynthesis glycosyltransferase
VSSWLRFRVHVDRLLAVVLLVLAGPVILALCVAIRRRDGGPSLITVPRVGRGGLPIRMWKLRSMRVEAPDGLANGLPLTAAHDHRITDIGRFMRAWHLDELPQLWNVLRGEMCLLGTRPEAPAFVDLEDPRWLSVLAGPPGIAGPTQLIVNDWERALISDPPDGTAYVGSVLPVKLAIDEWYVHQASVRLDAVVVLALVRRLLPGASDTRALSGRVRRDVPEVHEVLAYRHPTLVAAGRPARVSSM